MLQVDHLFGHPAVCSDVSVLAAGLAIPLHEASETTTGIAAVVTHSLYTVREAEPHVVDQAEVLSLHAKDGFCGPDAESDCLA